MTTIAHVTTVHPLADPRILRKECRALAEAGHDVYLIGPGRNEQETIPVEDGVRIIKTTFTRGRLGRAFKGSIRVWRELRRLRPKVVHGHDPEMLPLLLAWRLLNGRGVVIYDAHESLVGQIDGKPHIPRAARPFVKFIAWLLVNIVTRYLDGVVSATRHIEQEIPARRTCLVQNFPWASSFSDVEDTGSVRDFCYVGAISKTRGVEEMIEGLRLAKTESRVVMAGPQDAHAEAVLDENNDVVDYRGVVDSRDIPDLLRSSVAGFVLLHPVENYLRSQPTKLFEYMAAGIPFVASSFPYWIDLVGEFEAGYFVDISDANQIASAIRAVLDDPDETRRMGDRGRAAFKQLFSFDAQAAVFVAFIEELARD